MPELHLQSSGRSEISNLADELGKLGQEAATDAEVLSDLRALYWEFRRIVERAAAEQSRGR